MKVFLLALLSLLAVVAATEESPRFGASAVNLGGYTILTGGQHTAPLSFPPFPETFDDIYCDVQVFHQKYVDEFDWGPTGRFLDTDFPEMSSCRTFHSSAEWDDKIYVFGGAGRNNEVEVLDLFEEEWYIVNPHGPSPCGRYAHAYATGNGYFVIFGGIDAHTGHVLNDVWLFDFECEEWRDITPHKFGPSPRAGAAMAAVPNPFSFNLEDVFIVFGGTDNDAYNPTFYNDMWALDLSERRAEWRHITPDSGLPPARAYAAFGNAAYGTFAIFGGVGYGEDTLEFDHVASKQDQDYKTTETVKYLDDLWFFPIAALDYFYVNESNKWINEFPLEWIPSNRGPEDIWPSPRAAAAASTNRFSFSMTIFGGKQESRETLADVWTLNLAGNGDDSFANWDQRSCWPGYEFPWCIRDCSNFDYCSGHGTCLGDGTCNCDEGWSGASCDTNVCDGYRGFETDELNEILLPKSIESIYIKLDSIYHKLMYIRELLPSVDNTAILVRDMAIKSHDFYRDCLVGDLCEATEGFEGVIGCSDPCGSETYCIVNDTCINGVCQGGSPRDCREQFGDNKCVLSYCDEELGCQHTSVTCVEDFENHPCATVSCDPAVGCVYTAVDCDDGDCCTLDYCNPHTNQCEHVNKCEDRNPCTVNTCKDNCGTGYCHSEWDYCCYPNEGQNVFNTLDEEVYDPIASCDSLEFNGENMVPPQNHDHSAEGWFWLKGCGQCELVYRFEIDVPRHAVEEGVDVYALAAPGSVSGVVGTLTEETVYHHHRGRRVKEGVWDYCASGLTQWDVLSGNVYVTLYFNTGDMRANLNFEKNVPNLPEGATFYENAVHYTPYTPQEAGPQYPQGIDIHPFDNLKL